MENKNEPTLMTIATFNSGTEAHIVVSLLESRGVPCYLENEAMNTLYANVLGGVILKVSSEDFEEAKKILSEE